MEPELKEIKLYFAYTSPYTYLAFEPACALERTHRVRTRFIPFGVNIRQVYGDVDRPDHSRRKVKYLYLDAQRFAAEQGLVILPPRKIYSARIAMIGGLFAERHGRFRPYSQKIFERFFRRELEVEDVAAIQTLMREVGLDPDAFAIFLEGEGRQQLRDCFAAANSDQIFGVPTFVVDGELFWGNDRIDYVIRKLDAQGLRR